MAHSPLLRAFGKHWLKPLTLVALIAPLAWLAYQWALMLAGWTAAVNAFGGALPPARDYHRVQLASGERLWLCHAGGRWVVQGDLP
jgi:hypothetical protein